MHQLTHFKLCSFYSAVSHYYSFLLLFYIADVIYQYVDDEAAYFGYDQEYHYGYFLVNNDAPVDVDGKITTTILRRLRILSHLRPMIFAGLSETTQTC